MKLRPTLAALVLPLLPLTLPAQSVPSAPTAATEDENELTFATAADEWYVPKSTITFGFRLGRSGANVRFGNLGNVPSPQTVPDVTDPSLGRIFDNGTVGGDSPRPGEFQLDANGQPVLDANGRVIQTSTPGGRFTTTTIDANLNTIVTSDSLAFTPGLTRAWRINNSNQVQGDTVAFSNFSAVSEGGTATADDSGSSGAEVALARHLGKLGKRFEWSLVAGVSLNDLNAKTDGSVLATLNTFTQRFPLNGRTIPEGLLQAPTFNDLLDADGNLIASGGLETTVPLGIDPDPALTTETSVPGGATVQGNWQIKGAYFLMRVGPSIRLKMTERLGVNASLGLAGAYSGTRYSVVEMIELPGVDDAAPTPVTTVEENSRQKFLPGLYADFNVEWLANRRTGLFGGVSVQQLGDYNQSVGGRTARVDLGNSVGLRGGVSIKF